MAIKVLVVEDNPATLAAMESFLRSSGMEVRSAADASTALAITRRWHPDVAVVDVHLPDVEGHEVVRLLASQARDPAVVYVTGDAAAARRLEHHAVLLKPFGSADLVGAVRQALAHREPTAPPGAT